MLYMVTFTINIPPMLAYMPYMDPMGTHQLQVASDNFRAQVWNGGQGGQCPMMPSASGFGLCKTHAERHAAEGLAHGRVDGTIPLDACTILDRRVDETSDFLPKFMVTM